jgi:hypothetical protein
MKANAVTPVDFAATTFSSHGAAQSRIEIVLALSQAAALAASIPSRHPRSSLSALHRTVCPRIASNTRGKSAVRTIG